MNENSNDSEIKYSLFEDFNEQIEPQNVKSENISSNGTEIDEETMKLDEEFIDSQNVEHLNSSKCENRSYDEELPEMLPPLLTELERRDIQRNKRILNKEVKTKSHSNFVGNEVKNRPTTDVNEESDFNWEDYLEETNSVAAPPNSFLHVENSLENGFKVSMVIEILHNTEESRYWFAKIMMTCGPLLSLRYLGLEEDKAKEFWCDVKSQEVHPIGWCKENDAKIIPPSDVLEKLDSWEELLPIAYSSSSPPSYIFENGVTPIDQIKPGLKLEVQDIENPENVWIAKIIENVGGRLLLRYHGFNDDAFDFWLFYLSSRLHPVGWCQNSKCKYQPPDLKPSDFVQESFKAILSSIESKDMVPLEIFNKQKFIPTHEFKVGMKLEMLSPVDHLHFVPATVTGIVNDKYFHVEIDDYSAEKKSIKYCRHFASWDIFHANWAKKHGLKVQLPKDFDMPQCVSRSLEWDDYLKYTNSIAADSSLFADKSVLDEFKLEKGMRLEAVNPFKPEQLCAASITKVVKSLIWIQLDSVDAFNVHHVSSIKTHDIFPVGWCESNNYPLKPPRRWFSKRQKKLLSKDSQEEESSLSNVLAPGCDKDKVCPKIYINHRCFSGRFLSKGKIAELPRSVGPGSVQLVMKEVLSLLIASAYIPTRVHKELQLDGISRPNMAKHVIKAKYKGKSRRGIIEVAQYTNQVEDYCKEVCTRLECCPYLFGPTHVTEICPEFCHKLTKTQYTIPGQIRKPKRLMLSSKSAADENNASDRESDRSQDSDEPLSKQKKTLDRNENTTTNNSHIHEVTYGKTPVVVDITLPKILDIPKLVSNPLHWSVDEVVEYFMSSDCRWAATHFKNQLIDGTALLLLNLPTVKEYLNLKLGPAIQVCKHVESIKTAFYLQFSK